MNDQTPALGVPIVAEKPRTAAVPYARTGLHAAVPTPSPLNVTRLGRYHIVTRIATGGMAEVYLAVHGELSGFRTPVVLKKVLPHLAENQQFIDMFLDEARIASLLDHPNVVRIYEVGRIGAEHFLAMELVQGKPLTALIRRSFERGDKMEHRLAAFIVAQAAAGLHHAHELTDVTGEPLGLVHRDVSPQNILISFEGSVKVIDFGIARALGRISDTQTGGMKGKFGYMSPEQGRGEEVDSRTDIFALGVVLWEAICGRRLFHRDNDLATMRALLYDTIPRPSTIVSVAPELESIILRALSRNAKFRFPSARDMGSALERYVVQAGGATTSDLGALMKAYFAQEMQQWLQTVRAAIQAPSEPEPAPDLPLGGDLAAKTGVSGVTSEPLSPSIAPAGSGVGLTGITNNRVRLVWLLGALGLTILVGATGVFVGRSLDRPAAPARSTSLPAVTPVLVTPQPSPAVPTPAQVAPLPRPVIAAPPESLRKEPLPPTRKKVKPVRVRPAGPLNPGGSGVDRKTNPF